MVDLRADLTGRTALITGGSKGIGRATALALAANGAAVAIAGRNADDLQDAGRAIAAAGGDCLAIAADVTSVAGVYTMVEKACAWRGRLDILVNSAGINVQQSCLEVTEADWDRVLDTNLKGSFFCCQAASRKMLEQRWGRIVNITSTMALVGFFRRSAYCASKGGVAQFTKVMAIELAPYGINVNCVAPTFLNTPMTAPMLADQEFRAEVLRRIPQQRIGQPEDVTGAVLYLVSAAARMVTGSTILVDGGWVAW